MPPGTAGGLHAHSLFPHELWGCASLWLQPRDFARACQCCTGLFVGRERQILWRFFCYVNGYAQLAENIAGEIVIGRRESSSWVGAEVDWQRCFQLNALAEANRRGALFIRVRIRGEEAKDAGEDLLLQELQVPAEIDEKIIPDAHLPDFEAEPPAEDPRFYALGWRVPALLGQALRRMMAPCEVPFRFRELVCGRPGLRLRRVAFNSKSLAGAPCNVMVEWPIRRMSNGSWHWPLPPHSSSDNRFESTNPSDTQSYGPRPWNRDEGWIVELCAQFGPQGRPAEYRSKWVHVAPEKRADEVTVGKLCEELAPHLSALGLFLPHVEGGTRVSLRPGDLRRPNEPGEQVQPSMLLLRDLRWTQAERLRLVLAGPSPRSSQAAYRGVGHDGDAALPHVVVLFHRESCRPRRRLQRSRPRGVWDYFPASESEAASAGEALSSTSRARTPWTPSRQRESSDRSGTLPLPRRRGAVASRTEDANEVLDLPLEERAPHSRRLLLSSSGVRQFEFHPSWHGIMLAGRKDGVAVVLDHEADAQTHMLEVDTYPILGLSWLQTRPQWAVIGSSQSGTICVARYDESKPGRMERVDLEAFPHLSSLSSTCTDDYFATSGFCIDLALYDLCTGRRLNTFRGLHQNFINISRFANLSPHILATASFDHTCKVWDLREPIVADRPAMFFNTDTLNVMCCFSPDDRHILCSGVDTALQQFSLAKPQGHGASTGTRFPLPTLASDTNYRRSLYLADGTLVVTAATNESLLRIYTADAPHRHQGFIDFRNFLQGRRQHTNGGASSSSNSSSSGSASSSAAPRLGYQAGQAEAAGVAGNAPGEEYVQSLRCHPTDPSLLGALLSTRDAAAPLRRGCDTQPESFIAMLRLGEITQSSAPDDGG